MTPLIPALLILTLLSLPAAAQEDPFKDGVTAGNIQAVFNFPLPSSANIGPEVMDAGLFYSPSLFGGAAQCAAAATPLTQAKETWVEPYVEYEGHAFVLAKKGVDAFQVYRFHIMSSARYKTTRSYGHKIEGLGKKGAQNAAKDIFEGFHKRFTDAVAAAKCK